MPKVVTFSVFLPSASSSSAVCANADPQAVHNSNTASRFFMIASLVEGATSYPAPVRRQLRRSGAHQHANPAHSIAPARAASGHFRTAPCGSNIAHWVLAVWGVGGSVATHG